MKLEFSSIPPFQPMLPRILWRWLRFLKNDLLKNSSKVFLRFAGDAVKWPSQIPLVGSPHMLMERDALNTIQIIEILKVKLEYICELKKG